MAQLFAVVFAFLFIVVIVVGLAVNLYLYTHGAFKRGRSRRFKTPPLGAAIFSQTAIISESAADLYYGGAGMRPRDTMSAYSRRLLLYGLGFLVSLVVLAVLVLGVTQF
jgi:cytosine/uracil/thiamine/allantoin permease